MMSFLQPSVDSPLYTELKECGLLPPDVVDRIETKLNRPESGTLDHYLLAGADAISEPDWLRWLVRHHGCHRFGPVAWRDDAAMWARPDIASEPNRPFRRSLDGNPVIAVMRPDRWARTAAGYAGYRPERAAATLAEIRELKAAWARWELGVGTLS
jgi:hypothetical protein